MGTLPSDTRATDPYSIGIMVIDGTGTGTGNNLRTTNRSATQLLVWQSGDVGRGLAGGWCRTANCVISMKTAVRHIGSLYTPSSGALSANNGIDPPAELFPAVSAFVRLPALAR